MFIVRFTGDEAELGIIRVGQFMKVQVVLNPRVHLVTGSILLWRLTYCSKHDLNVWLFALLFLPEGSVSH